MGYEEDLGRLESSIERLLGSLEQLRQSNELLKNELLQKEQENDGLQAEVMRLRKDKHAIHQRVNDLIVSIEKWETSHAKDGDVTPPLAETDADATVLDQVEQG